MGAFQSPRTGSEARLHSDKLEVLFAPGGGKLNAIAAKDNVICEQGTTGMTNYLKLTCRALTAKAENATNSEPTELVAAGGVRIEQPGTLARSEQAVYNRRTDILKLIGQPVIERPEGTYSSNRELEWDKGHGTVSGSDYKITGNPETLKRLSTNALSTTRSNKLELKPAPESQKLPGQ